MSTFDDDDMARWMTLMNKGHGYAGVFNAGNAEKPFVEASTFFEWSRSAKALLGFEVESFRRSPADPPDFFATIAGQQYAIELRQFVDHAHKKRALRGETPYAGQLFLDTQWDEQRLYASLNEAIDEKAEKYLQANVCVDLLLLHTDEPWLSHEMAMRFLEGKDFSSRENIGSVHLLFSYEAGRGTDLWPLLPIYGDFPVN